MDELEKLEKEIGIEKVEEVNPNHLTDTEVWKLRWEKIKVWRDWSKTPLDILVFIILTIGAYLMGLSLYAMTKSLVIAVLSPVFTELGLTASHIVHERAKNNERQKSMTKKLRGWFVISTVALLVMNLVIESATSNLGIKADGLEYAVFAMVGLGATFVINTYFKFRDVDDELKMKNDFTKKMEKIRQDRIQSSLDIYAEAEKDKADLEKIKADEHAKFSKEYAPDIVREQGRIDAAKEIDEKYKNSSMTPEQVREIFSKIGVAQGEVVDEQEDNSGKRKYIQSGKYKKPQLQKPQPETESVPQLEETNVPFSEGEKPNLDLEALGAIEKLKVTPDPFKEA